MKLPTETEIQNLHKKYAPNETDYQGVYKHCEIVAEIALWCADNVKEKVDKDVLKTAALLHDIGSYPFLAAWEVREEYRKWYVQHGILGAKILQDEGVDERVWNIVETHVLMGLTKDEIVKTDMRLPPRNYEPSTIEGRILCYADRFHSKDPNFNNFESFYNRLLESLPLQAAKFMAWSKEFGIPGINELAAKYDHPIR